ncbi:MAG TPA: SDR family oxidoreductase [Spirochaetia bacterium]|nr:SDR family oxidoreductase [Spirochaetia bacterium]
MVKIDLGGKSALITGGTRGIGLAAALELGKAGVRTYLTYKWGTADEGELFAQFEREGAPRPLLVQADVSVDEDTDRVMEAIAAVESRVDFFISNVGFAATVRSLDDYKKRSLFKTLEYSTWPLVAYTQKIHARFGSYPEKILGISSDGPDHFYQGYDFVAASKALLEFFSRYLSIHLFAEGTRVNVIRFGTVKTDSFDAIFGEEYFEYIRASGADERMILDPQTCGKTILAMCSGLLDAVNGQIISVDYGLPFQDNTMMRYLSSRKSAGD